MGGGGRVRVLLIERPGEPADLLVEGIDEFEYHHIEWYWASTYAINKRDERDGLIEAVTDDIAELPAGSAVRKELLCFRQALIERRAWDDLACVRLALSAEG